MLHVELVIARRDVWRLLGVIFVVCVILAIASIIVDWAIIGQLEGRAF